MGYTLAEKILASKCEYEQVHAGQFINARVDIVLASELSGILAIEEFQKILAPKQVFRFYQLDNKLEVTEKAILARDVPLVN